MVKRAFGNQRIVGNENGDNRSKVIAIAFADLPHDHAGIVENDTVALPGSAGVLAGM